MYFNLIFRTIFMYFFVIFVYRLMGKKEVGQLSIIDLIVSILIAELIALSIQTEKSIFISVVPILVLVGVQIFISYITLKSDKIRTLLDGKPTVIIKNGKLNFTEMSKLRYSLDDLLTQLRLQGVKSIDKVKYAILENNGNLSVFNDNSDYPLPLILDSVKYAILENNGNLSVFNDNSDYPLPLILDGVIDYDVLKEIKKDYNWIINVLKKRNLELDEVFYAFYTNKKVFIIDKRELL